MSIAQTNSTTSGDFNLASTWATPIQVANGITIQNGHTITVPNGSTFYSGKINFSENQLKENLLAVYNSIEKNKPSGVKGKYFKSFTICTTMSPSIKLELNNLKTK